MKLLPGSFRFRTFLPFLALFLSILVLFLLLSGLLHPVQTYGWMGIVLFLFLYFVGEPLYRYATDRWEIHVLVLEVYVFSAFLIQLFFPGSPFVYLFYMIPVFSAALSFGLLGTMLTSMAIFSLEMMRYYLAFARPEYQLSFVLVKTLPIFILALILGFTVELKNRIQRQLLNRLSRMDVFKTLQGVLDIRGEERPFDREFLDRIVDLTDVPGGLLMEDEGSVLERVGVSESEAQSLRDDFETDNQSAPHSITLDWEGDRYRILLARSSLSGVLIEAEEKMIQALGVYIHHLIDQQRLEVELSRENRYREAIFEAVPTGILISESNGTIVESNPAANDMVGNQSELKKTVQELFSIDDRPVQLKPTRSEATLLAEDGEIPVDLAIERIAYLDNDTSQWIFVFSDLTPLKELERQAARKRRLVALGELGAGLAHEIRNPLGSLSGFVSLLEENIDDSQESHKDIVKKIRSSYNQIDELVSQFVQYAREPGPNRDQFNLNELIRTIVENLRQPERLTLNVVHGTEDVRLTGDPNRLKLVIRNILRNARDATDSDGTVTIRVEQVNDRVEIAVEDDGIGIEPDRVDKIFDPFVSYRDEGLGLGLSTAHRIITEEFSGEINVDSTVGEGTSMTIVIPAHDTNLSSETAE